ncbi:hypothetical protein CKAN_02023200 [Cinnamomum micranthum f. kanehirae]|uniref:Uncharacterized protein n=1 Tax=Cinnamomum micranthum f. kanehirae TaxID=337451 RepID=A0A3S3PI39_9MAGN|nr:hypothetical protein CKAN_02023200 [Cinnamomum micranthum f. kanehirae]
MRAGPTYCQTRFCGLWSESSPLPKRTYKHTRTRTSKALILTLPSSLSLTHTFVSVPSNHFPFWKLSAVSNRISCISRHHHRPAPSVRCRSLAAAVTKRHHRGPPRLFVTSTEVEDGIVYLAPQSSARPLASGRLLTIAIVRARSLFPAPSLRKGQRNPSPLRTVN